MGVVLGRYTIYHIRYILPPYGHLLFSLSLTHMETIQNNLRYYRKLKGLTQWDVARHLGHKDIIQISKWEHGKFCPHVFTAIKIAKFLGVTTEDLYIN